MTAASCKHHLNIGDRISSSRPEIERIFHAMLNSRNKFAGNLTADNIVPEDKAAIGLSRTNRKDDMRIVSFATGLLLIPEIAINAPGDRFTVRDIWLTDICLDMKLPHQPGCNNLKMKLAHSRNKCLARVFITSDLEGWIVFAQFCQRHS